MIESPRRHVAALASVGVGALCACALLLLLAAWVWMPDRHAVSGLSIAIQAVAGSIVAFDTLDLVMRLYFRRVHGGNGPTSIPVNVCRFTPYQMRLQLRPFAILVSVHNLSDRARDFVEGLGPFRDRLYVVDDASTDDTAVELEHLGVPVLRGVINRKKPGALRALLRTIPADVATVIVMDPDVTIDVTSGEAGLTWLERVVFDFQRSGMAAACPRILVHEDGLWGDFQCLEYTIALEIGRKGMGEHSLTSGVALYRRDALERTLAQHSLSVYAEDFSNALILLSSGEKIYYDGRLSVTTYAQRSLPRLFSQRVGWAFGFLQVFVRDFDRILRASAGRPLLTYQFLIYAGALGLVLHPVRLAGLLLLFASLLNGVDNTLHLGWIADSHWVDPRHFLATYAHYTVLVVVQVLLSFRRGERGRVWPIVPFYFFYAVLQSIPNTIGYLNWISLRVVGRRIYRDHYETNEVLIRQQMATV
jgi:cellulose synthase/poly-beta-1,6-N-acetylglucosamine synthase-like glycosyltransferase